MSFADELRRIPDELKRADEMQRLSDWNRLKCELYNLVKNGCMRAAKEGDNSHYIYFDDLLMQIDEEVHKDSRRYEPCDKEKVQWWKRIENRLYRQLTPTSKMDPKPYLWEDEYTELTTYLGDLLTKDGLQVTIKPSRWEKKKFGNRNGRLQFVKDGYAYKFNLHLRW